MIKSSVVVGLEIYYRGICRSTSTTVAEEKNEEEHLDLYDYFPSSRIFPFGRNGSHDVF